MRKLPLTNLTRQQIETYYKDEWNGLVSNQTLKVLSELTCKEYKLNQPDIPENVVKESNKPKPLDLGEV